MAAEGINWGAVVAAIIVILLLVVWSNAIPPLTNAALGLGQNFNLVWAGIAPIIDTLKAWTSSLIGPSVSDAQKTLQQADTAAKVLNAKVDAATTALAATPLVKEQLQKDVTTASEMIKNSDKIIADAAANRPQDLPKIQEQLKQAATIVAGAPSMMQQIDANAAAAAKVLNEAPKQAAVIDAATQKANKVIAVAKVEDAKAKAEADKKAAEAAQKKKEDEAKAALAAKAKAEADAKALAAAKAKADADAKAAAKKLAEAKTAAEAKKAKEEAEKKLAEAKKLADAKAAAEKKAKEAKLAAEKKIADAKKAEEAKKAAANLIAGLAKTAAAIKAAPTAPAKAPATPAKAPATPAKAPVAAPKAPAKAPVAAPSRGAWRRAPKAPAKAPVAVPKAPAKAPPVKAVGGIAAAGAAQKSGVASVAKAQAATNTTIAKIAGTGTAGTAASKAVDAKMNKVGAAIANPGQAAKNYANNMIKNLNPVSADIVRVNTGKGQAADEALAIVLTAKRTMDAMPPGVPMQVKLVAAGAMVVATETKRIVKLVEWQSKIPCPSGFRNDGAYCFKPAPYGRGAGYPWKFGDGLNDKGMYKRCKKDNKQGCEKNGAIVYPKCKPGYFNVGCCTCSPKCPANMKDIGISCHKPMPPPGTI